MRVPVYGEQQVRLQPLSGARARDVSTPEAFGVNIGQGIQQAGRRLGDVAELLAARQDRLDEANAKKLDIEAAAQSQSVLDGYQKQLGQNALTARPGVEEALNKLEREVLARAPTVQQRELARQAIATRRLQWNGLIERHAVQQERQYVNQTSADYISQQLSEAETCAVAGDDASYSARLELARDQTFKFARDNGFDPAAYTATKMRAFASDVAAAVVSRHLAEGKVDEAETFLDREESKITVAQAATLRARILDESTVLDAEAEAEAVFSGREAAVTADADTEGAPLRAAPTTARGPIQQAIIAEAERQGEDANLALRMAAVESSFEPTAKNGSSRGLYQFQPGTWAEEGGAPGAELNAEENIKRGIQHIKKNRTRLRAKLGREPTDGEIYLAHQQGFGGAIALLSAPAGMSAVDALQRAGVKNARAHITRNGGTEAMSAADFAGKWSRKIAGARAVPAGRAPVGEAPPVAAPPSSLSEALARGRALGGTRREIKARDDAIRARWNEQEAAKTAQERAALDALQPYLTLRPDGRLPVSSVSQIPPAVRAALPRDKLREVTNAIIVANKPGVRPTDEVFFGDLYSMTPEEFVQVDPAKALPKLAAADYQQFVKDQATRRRELSEGGKSERTVSVERTNAIARLVMPPKLGGEGEARFKAALFRTVADIERTTGKPATDQDIDRAASKLMLEVAKRPLWDFSTGDKFGWSDIPADEKGRITNDLRARLGRDPVRREVLDTWRAAKAAGLL
jgi:hypothetical protein